VASKYLLPFVGPHHVWLLKDIFLFPSVSVHAAEASSGREYPLLSPPLSFSTNVAKALQFKRPKAPTIQIYSGRRCVLARPGGDSAFSLKISVLLQEVTEVDIHITQPSPTAETTCGEISGLFPSGSTRVVERPCFYVVTWDFVLSRATMNFDLLKIPPGIPASAPPSGIELLKSFLFRVPELFARSNDIFLNVMALLEGLALRFDSKRFRAFSALAKEKSLLRTRHFVPHSLEVVETLHPSLGPPA